MSSRPPPSDGLFSFGLMTPGSTSYGAPTASTSRSTHSASPQFSSTAANPSNLLTSPYSPFPFGSPITHSRRSVLNPGNIAGAEDTAATASNRAKRVSPIQTRVRLRGRDLYGGLFHTFNGNFHFQTI